MCNISKSIELTWYAKKNDIRIILSIIFHDSHESCISIRGTMLSWFIEMFKDHKTLKNVETNIWFELIIIHRDLILFEQTSFDFARHFDVMSYCFFISMKLTDLDSLSNALICRKKWNSFAMIVDRDIYLDSKMKFDKTRIAWRIHVICQIIIFFQLVKKIEMKTFDKNFYFHFRKRYSTKRVFIFSLDVESAQSFVDQWLHLLIVNE